MKIFKRMIFLVCGIVLTLAAVPVFAQQEEKIEINKMPFNDFALMLKQRVDAREVDLTKPFSIELDGVLDGSGRLDGRTSKFKGAGDAAMIQVGREFIIALGDSGFLGHLKDFDVEKLNLTLAQDDKQIRVKITSELKTPERAKTIVSALNSIVRLVPMMEKEGRNKLDDDEKILITALKAKSEDKKLVLELAYEKTVIQEMINRKLKQIGAKQTASE